jgi:hypothetical protein
MQDVPREALITAVRTAKDNEAQILKIKLLYSMGLITEDEALNTYEQILRDTDSLQRLSSTATEHVLEMSPPKLRPPSDAMNVAHAELRALAADLERDPTSRQIAREIARVNAQELAPAAASWYAASVGQVGAIKEGNPLLCSGNARVESLGPRGLGVAAAGVTVDPMIGKPVQ